MRTRTVRTILIAALVGAIAGCVVALVGNWWVLRGLPPEFGWASYAPLPDDAVAPGMVASSVWHLMWPAALAGAVVAVLGTFALTVRRGRVTPLPDRWRGIAALATLGAVLGVAVGAALYLHAGSGGAALGQPRRYVDYAPTSGDGSYVSTLTITLDDRPTRIAGLLGVCGATGLAGGLAAGGVLAVARRR